MFIEGLPEARSYFMQRVEDMVPILNEGWGALPNKGHKKGWVRRQAGVVAHQAWMASPGVVINSVHIVMLQGPSARMTSSNLCFGRIPPSGEGRLDQGKPEADESVRGLLQWSKQNSTSSGGEDRKKGIDARGTT